MGKELTLASTPYYDQMNEVITLHLEGRNASWIAKALAIKRADVLTYIDDFKAIAKDDDLLRARAKEVVREFDEQHNRIIADMWEVSKDAEAKSDLKTRATILKSLSDVTAKRVEVLQKSGLLSDAALGDEMAALEEQHEQLIAILRDVTSNCNHCKFEVNHRLTMLTGKVEPVNVESDREV
jgi:hypothetical protein